MVVEEDGKISYTKNVTNEEVLRTIGEKRLLLILITYRKKNWIGHVRRVDGIIRSKEIIEGKDESKTKYRKAKNRDVS